MRNSGSLLAKLRSEGGLNLVVPVDTRFASLFMMMERLADIKFKLAELVGSEQWHTVLVKGKRKKQKIMHHIKVCQIRNMLLLLIFTQPFSHYAGLGAEGQHVGEGGGGGGDHQADDEAHEALR